MRSVPEWVGKNDDQRVPDNVQKRILRKYDFTCQGPCHMRLVPGRWALDHEIALCNGGKHVEGNLRPMCPSCHSRKTRADVGIKAAADQQCKSLWIAKRPHHIIPGSRASNMKKCLDGRVIDRRTGKEWGQ